MQNLSAYTLPPRWEILTNEVAPGSVWALTRELSPGHELYGKKVVAIARDFDDILFEVQDGQKPFAVVHLTHRVADSPPWPDTFWYSSIEEWIAEWLLRS